jgi:alkylhydroperoxidase family enzyme
MSSLAEEIAILQRRVRDLTDDLERKDLEAGHYEAALQSIAKNTCCDRCQEAALVAQTALKRPYTRADYDAAPEDGTRVNRT